MSNYPKDQRKPAEMHDADEYAEMELLERLETLREDMEGLGATSLDEVNQRIEELQYRKPMTNDDIA